MFLKPSEKDNSNLQFPKLKILTLQDNKMDTEILWLTNLQLFTLMLIRFLLVQTKRKKKSKECLIKPKDILFLTLGIQLSLDLNYSVINSKRNLNWEPLQKLPKKLKMPMTPLPWKKSLLDLKPVPKPKLTTWLLKKKNSPLLENCFKNCKKELKN